MPDKADFNCIAFGTETFLDRKPEEFTGKVFRGCGWSFETPLTQVFPEGVKDVRFVGCRLDNIVLPPGSVMDADCSHYQYKVQPDGKDWVGEITTDSKDATKTVFTAKAIIGEASALPYKTGAVKTSAEAVK
jgi:hypothetical protein